ncbi:MAG: sugar phosphate isomerase/epimerase [Clostridia bacterium]|nr:sugar phosphate isomerase/epimerase [Clostridia bacterium]
MKIVTITDNDHTRRGGIGAVLRMLANAGFDGADITMTNMEEKWRFDTPAFLGEVRAAQADCGIEIRQAHAPFPGKKYGDEDYNRRYDAAVRLSIEIAGELGAHTIIVHPIYCPTLSAKEQMEWNIDYYQSLASTAKQAGVRIALENMYCCPMPDRFAPNVCSLPAEFSAYYDRLDQSVFTCCLDIGHFAMLGCPPEKAILEMGHDRVGTLHIHDNDRIHDFHNPPFTGDIRWENVVSALAQIDYAGDVSFEVHMLKYPTELLPAAYTSLCQVGRYLAGRIEAYKNKNE